MTSACTSGSWVRTPSSKNAVPTASYQRSTASFPCSRRISAPTRIWPQPYDHGRSHGCFFPASRLISSSEKKRHVMSTAYLRADVADPSGRLVRVRAHRVEEPLDPFRRRLGHVASLPGLRSGDERAADRPAAEVWDDVVRRVRRPHRRAVAAADRLPGLDGPGPGRPHDRHRDDAARRRRRRSRTSATHPTSATTSASSTSSGSCSTATARGAETLADFRRVTGRRLDALRGAPARQVGRGRVHARGAGAVPPVHGDPRLRLLVPRPGHPRSARPPRLPRRPGRRPRRSGASPPRRCRTSSARRPTRRRARRSCSTSPVSRRSMRRSASKAGPRCSRPARSRRPRGSRSTGERSRDWPAGAGPGSVARASGLVQVEGDDDLGDAHRRQPRVHDLTATSGRTTSLHAGGRRLPGRAPAGQHAAGTDEPDRRQQQRLRVAAGEGQRRAVRVTAGRC